MDARCEKGIRRPSSRPVLFLVVLAVLAVLAVLGAMVLAIFPGYALGAEETVYTIVYDANGGTLTTPEGDVVETYTVTLSEDELDGYEQLDYTDFEWYGHRASTALAAYDTDTGEMIHAHYDDEGTYVAASSYAVYYFRKGYTTITLKPLWNYVDYVIVYDANGGSATDADGVEYTEINSFDDLGCYAYYYSKNLDTNPRIVAENPYSRAGYVFAGWNTEADGTGQWWYPGDDALDDLVPYLDYATPGSADRVTPSVSSSATLYAQWKRGSMLLTMYGNGGETSEGTSTFRFVGYLDASVLFVKCNDDLGFAREGYSFCGWNTEPDGSGVWYAEGHAINTVVAEWDADAMGAIVDDAGSGYVSLYAQWEADAVRQILTRVGGENRYETMAKIAATAFPDGSEWAVVASGAGYADALSASALAGALDAPVVLTSPDSLSADAAGAISDCGASKVVVVGGAAAVPDSVVAQIESIEGVVSVERVSGEDRYETSAAIYEWGVENGIEWSGSAILATGAGYADALSASSYAYATSTPVFLTRADALPDSVAEALCGGSFSSATLAGGPAAVSSAVYESVDVFVGDTIRIAGADRYETSGAFAEWAISRGLSADGCVFATGSDYPDALAASALAGSSDSVVVLVSEGSDEYLSFASAHAGNISAAYVVGGEKAVGKALFEAIEAAIAG